MISQLSGRMQCCLLTDVGSNLGSYTGITSPSLEISRDFSPYWFSFFFLIKFYDRHILVEVTTLLKS